jgi:hypothetical protein
MESNVDDDDDDDDGGGGGGGGGGDDDDDDDDDGSPSVDTAISPPLPTPEKSSLFPASDVAACATGKQGLCAVEVTTWARDDGGEEEQASMIHWPDDDGGVEQHSSYSGEISRSGALP